MSQQYTEKSLVQFSCSVVSDALRPHGLQHTRLPCPSPTPRACSNSCPSSWRCHPTIWSSVVPFSSCPQSFPASGPCLMSQFLTSGGQSIGASASASVLPMSNSGLIFFRMDWLDLLAVQGTLKSLLQHHRSKASILQQSAFITVPLSHPHYWKSSSDDNASFPLNQKACGSSILTLVSFIHKIWWELWWTPQLTEAFGIDKQMYI